MLGSMIEGDNGGLSTIRQDFLVLQSPKDHDDGFWAMSSSVRGHVIARRLTGADQLSNVAGPALPGTTTTTTHVTTNMVSSTRSFDRSVSRPPGLRPSFSMIPHSFGFDFLFMERRRHQRLLICRLPSVGAPRVFFTPSLRVHFFFFFQVFFPGAPSRPRLPSGRSSAQG